MQADKAHQDTRSLRRRAALAKRKQAPASRSSDGGFAAAVTTSSDLINVLLITLSVAGAVGRRHAPRSRPEQLGRLMGLMRRGALALACAAPGRRRGRKPSELRDMGAGLLAALVKGVRLHSRTRECSAHAMEPLDKVDHVSASLSVHHHAHAPARALQHDVDPPRFPPSPSLSLLLPPSPSLSVSSTHANAHIATSAGSKPGARHRSVGGGRRGRRGQSCSILHRDDLIFLISRSTSSSVCVCVCVCVRARECVRACVRVSHLKPVWRRGEPG